MARLKDRIGPSNQVVKANTRLSSDFQLQLLKKEEESEKLTQSSVPKNQFDFTVPLTKQEIQEAQEKKEKERQKAALDLGELIAKNRGLIPKSDASEVG